MACILLRSSAVKVHDSQAYSKMGVTRECIGCVLELRKILLSLQELREIPLSTGPSRWTGCNHRSHNNLQQDLADWRMANTVDPILGYQTSQEKQPAAVPELQNNQPHQSPKQSHAEDHTEHIEATSGEDHR